MKVYLNNINVWLQGLDDTASLVLWANKKLNLPEEYTPPKPQYYPKGQLRRLSPFSKVILNSLDISQALTQNLPLIFASQHGDLAKTVNLIKDTALNEDLSPTQFALSVHNATTGLFSITTDNTAPTTTISAGKNTFVEGLVEAFMQCQQEKKSVIYSYCDFDVPQEYYQFEERQPARCISMILSHTSDGKSDDLATIDFVLDNQKTHCAEQPPSDLSLQFIRKFYLQSDEVMRSKSYSLCLGFNECRR